MEKELNYFASFPAELKKYRGKHVAIIGDKVVASGDNAIEVYKKAKEKYPDKNPVLAFVPREETLILVNR
ncbi:succinyl-CoA synthetase subunit alpha [Archaeoglobales archaeon ex4484_92]|nr:MAG: succinyl-CoA synthetase subunit alpha [Archaeoglobales archaeon ex4484_92]